MNFIIDAHLPRSICKHFSDGTNQVIHTSRLPSQNLTSDDEINRLAVRLNAAVITKDIDFFHSFNLKNEPPKLVLVKIGNMRLAQMRLLFEQHAARIAQLLQNHDLIELHQNQIVVIQ